MVKLYVRNVTKIIYNINMKKKIHKQGKLRADKITYPDGIGCCVWYPLVERGKVEDEETGICFDFSYDDIDDFIKLLQKLKKAKANVYKEVK